MQKVYVTEEEKEKFMEKLNRDVEVRLSLRTSATWGQHQSTTVDAPEEQRRKNFHRPEAEMKTKLR